MRGRGRRSANAESCRARRTTNALLACGIAYPVAYVIANDVVGASRYPGYSRRDQAVSELSATGAPPRTFLTGVLPVHAALATAFGAGVWRSARGRRSLRAAGALLMASGVTSVAWAPFPMSSREDIVAGKGSTNDTGHLVLSALTVAEIVGLLGAGSGSFGRGFRTYSLASAATVLATGSLTSWQAARLPSGRPTPGMGLYERLSIGAWLQWMAALATVLLRERRSCR